MADSNLNLQAFREQRDTAIKARARWDCSIETVLEAYMQGERDFRGADLNGADLRGADLRGADLREADLRRADLRRADLREADLREADLSEANLRGADLSGADLREADLSEADLREADLREADLRAGDVHDGFSVFQCGPVGSRKAYVTATSNDGVQEIRTGCFRGTLAEFVAAVENKPDGDQYRIEYETIVIPALRAFFALREVVKETGE